MSLTDKLLAEISGKMDKMLRLLAISTMKETEKEQDKIELLDSLGFRPTEIAKFLNKSQDNVNVQLSGIRKKKQARTKLEGTEQPQTSASSEKDMTNVLALNLQKKEDTQNG
jgi:DNA-directed RNA polymerase specialized sigma24 family protein